MTRLLTTIALLLASLLAIAAGSTARAADAASEHKKVVFLVGKPSHGFGAHDHLAGCSLLAA